MNSNEFDTCVLNRILHGKGVTWPPFLCTIESMWSGAMTAGRGSAPWSAWTTQQMRTVFGTPSPPWMFGEALLELQHLEVRDILCSVILVPSLKSPVIFFVHLHFSCLMRELWCYWLLTDMIYVAGGFDGSRRHTSMERYDPNIDQWSMLGDMQTAREGAGLVVASGLIYCLGMETKIHSHQNLIITWAQILTLKPA